MFSGEFLRRSRSKKFCSSFFKSSQVLRAAPWVARRNERNNLIVRKRHRRVNFRQRRKEGGPLVGVLRLGEGKNRTSGGFPFIRKENLNSLPAFFFGRRSAKKKAWQKRNAQKELFRSLRRATNAPRVGWAVAFWKKRRKNFQTDKVYLSDKSKFES